MISDDGMVVGRGLTADVIATSDREVVKLFRADRFADGVDAEFRRAEAVNRSGLPTPRVLRRELIDGRSGIAFERVVGCSLMDAIGRRPWAIHRYAVTLAALTDRIGRTSISGLGSLKDHIRSNLLQADLPADRRDHLLGRLDQLPDRDETLCHFDFHPGHVLMAPNGPVIIDWANCRNGDHAADIAQTIVLLTCGALSPDTKRQALIRVGRRAFATMFRRSATGHSPDLARRVEQWLPVVAGARLAEQQAGEREALLSVIARRL